MSVLNKLLGFPGSQGKEGHFQKEIHLAIMGLLPWGTIQSPGVTSAPEAIHSEQEFRFMVHFCLFVCLLRGGGRHIHFVCRSPLLPSSLSCLVFGG